jgi:hypothetical protein
VQLYFNGAGYTLFDFTMCGGSNDLKCYVTEGAEYLITVHKTTGDFHFYNGSQQFLAAPSGHIKTQKFSNLKALIFGAIIVDPLNIRQLAFIVKEYAT